MTTPWCGAAILSLQGSFLLLFTSAVTLFDTTEAYNHHCHAWIELIVSVLFLLAVYLPYVELINLPDSSRRYFWPHRWSDVKERVQTVSIVGVSWISFPPERFFPCLSSLDISVFLTFRLFWIFSFPYFEFADGPCRILIHL